MTFNYSRTDDFTVRQIKVKEYPRAFQLVDDEAGLMALACDHPKAVIEELLPECYEEVRKKMEDINKAGFFTFADRKMNQASKNLASIPSETLARMLKKPALPTQS